MRWAVAVLLAGVLVAFVPALLAGDRFIVQRFDGEAWLLGGRTGADGLARLPLPEWRGMALIPAGRGRSSLLTIARNELPWAVSVATLLVAPLLFVWWRRSAIGFGRTAGATTSVAAAGAVCAHVLTRSVDEHVSLDPMWWTTFPAGAALMAIAFLVAPAPRVRDE
jgi:hypothetical protein